mmetsp:Transcript_56521/g.68017  ORF Transcript_56521/g.68017 Transcript_56521/m.68017 type:complete len:95 (+) Transcript_56521:149-433(+)
MYERIVHLNIFHLSFQSIPFTLNQTCYIPQKNLGRSDYLFMCCEIGFKGSPRCILSNCCCSKSSFSASSEIIATLSPLIMYNPRSTNSTGSSTL